MQQVFVLVVDDDPKVRRLLRRCFEGGGYSVSEADSRKETLAAIKRHDFDLITLDLSLGDDSGLSIAQDVRKVSDVPIIMVTGKDDVIDRVVGLELGADDYITKPFHVREVIARSKSVLRRWQAAKNGSSQPKENGSKETCITFDGLTLCPDRFELLDREGNTADLTSGDMKLLQIFAERPKRILSREQIMTLLRGPEWTPLDRTIDNQIARLRKKIERDPVNPKIIKTVRGVGYTFSTPVERVKG